jgi:hypothetical protein
MNQFLSDKENDIVRMREREREKEKEREGGIEDQFRR